MNGRPDLPIHDHFALDQPDSALVHADPIVPRQHPFAFPYVWRPEFEARERVATEHIHRIGQRLTAASPDPLLGMPLDQLLNDLFLPEWKLEDGTLISKRSVIRRGAEGDPIPLA